MSNCIFCKIAAGEIPSTMIYQDDEMFAIRDINPRAETHVLLIPREHLESLAQGDDQHHALLGNMMLRLPRVAQELGLDTGFRTIINTGPGGGQEVPHLHMHILGGKRLSGF